jgi:hypothetical protein
VSGTKKKVDLKGQKMDPTWRVRRVALTELVRHLVQTHDCSRKRRLATRLASPLYCSGVYGRKRGTDTHTKKKQMRRRRK